MKKFYYKEEKQGKIELFFENDLHSQRFFKLVEESKIEKDNKTLAFFYLLSSSLLHSKENIFYKEGKIKDSDGWYMASSERIFKNLAFSLAGYADNSMSIEEIFNTCLDKENKKIALEAIRIRYA